MHVYSVNQIVRWSIVYAMKSNIFIKSICLTQRQSAEILGKYYHGHYCIYSLQLNYRVASLLKIFAFDEHIFLGIL